MDNIKKLNDIIVNLRGEHIGYVPISNLVDNFDKSLNVEKLYNVFVEDGDKVKIETYKDGAQELSIYID